MAIVCGCVAATAGAEVIRLTARQTVTLHYAGATAAYSLDAEVAEAAGNDGNITIHALRAGKTQIILVRPAGVETVELVVVAPPVVTPFGSSAIAGAALTAVDVLYSSETKRLISTIDSSRQVGSKTTRFHLADMTQVGNRRASDPVTSIPSISFRVTTPEHDFTALDALVHHSPLTVSGTTLRGAHYTGDKLELHAGYTTPLLFQNVLLPAASEGAVGGAYRIRAGKSSFRPTAFHFSGARRYGGTPGLMGSLVYEYGARADRLHLIGEVGYGGTLGAGAHVAYSGRMHQVAFSARHQPPEFSSLAFGRRIGTFVDGRWAGKISPAFSLHANGELVDQQLPFFRQRNATSSVGLRYRIADHLMASVDGTLAQFDGDGLSTTVRSVTVPLGLSLDGRHFAVSGVYRRQQNTASNLGGNGGRISARATLSDLSISGSLDYQQDAATTDLVFRSVPELARIFVELGLTAQTPEDIVRLLRDNATLIALGYLDAPTVTVQPWRRHSAAKIAWRTQGKWRQRLELHVVNDRVQTVGRLRQTTLGSVSYSTRVVGSLDMLATVGAWRNDSGTSSALRSRWFSIGTRIRFRGAPSIPFGRGGNVTGVVYRDDEATGTGGPSMPGIAGVRVMLDGVRQTLTDAEGRFVFAVSGGGPHRVEVLVPSGAAAYFTGVSSKMLNPGDHGSFTLGYLPARVYGYLRDDISAPIGGVRLHLLQSEREQTTETDSSGRYAFSVAPGDYRLQVQGSSLPAGYDALALTPRDVSLLRTAPLQADFVAAASRSIAGVVKAARPETIVVTLREIARTTRPDTEGRYIFRNLKPGQYTVEALIDGSVLSHQVQISGRPVLLTVDFEQARGRPQ